MTNMARMFALYLNVYEIDQAKLAAQIGICPSTLTRIKSGKMPDAEGYARVMLWMSQPAPKPKGTK